MAEKTQVFLDKNGQPVREGDPSAVESISVHEARRRKVRGYEPCWGAGIPADKSAEPGAQKA